MCLIVKIGWTKNGGRLSQPTKIRHNLKPKKVQQISKKWGVKNSEYFTSVKLTDISGHFGEHSISRAKNPWHQFSSPILWFQRKFRIFLLFFFFSYTPCDLSFPLSRNCFWTCATFGNGVASFWFTHPEAKVWGGSTQKSRALSAWKSKQKTCSLYNMMPLILHKSTLTSFSQ